MRRLWSVHLNIVDYSVKTSLVTPQPLDFKGTRRFFSLLKLLKNFFKLLSVHLKESLGLLRLILPLKLDQARYGCQVLFWWLRWRIWWYLLLPWWFASLTTDGRYRILSNVWFLNFFLRDNLHMMRTHALNGREHSRATSFFVSESRMPGFHSLIKSVWGLVPFVQHGAWKASNYPLLKVKCLVWHELSRAELWGHLAVFVILVVQGRY